MIVGRHTYGTPRVVGTGEHRVTIGAFCSIGPGVTLLPCAEHPTDWVSTFPFPQLWGVKGIDGIPAGGDITIGNDVWLGMDCMVLSGVTIGDGAVIAARAVVTRDVPPYVVAGGVPARLLRPRFSRPLADRLLRLKWWEWPDEKIRELAPLLCSPDIEKFLEAAES